MRSGSTGPPRRRSRSWPGGCWRSASASCSPSATLATSTSIRLPELVVGGLGDDDARLLLASAMPGRLDEHVRDQIVAETRGNPLALLELPRGLAPAELAGGFGLPDARSPGN